MTPTIPCNLCQAENVEPVRFRDRHGANLIAVICKDCGLVWTDPRPTEEAVRRFYESEYRLSYKQTYKPQLKHTYRSGKAALERYARIQHLLQPGMKALDMAAGSGELLYMLRTKGVDALGIEPNEGYAAYCREDLGLPVSQGFWQDANIAEGSLDLLTVFHAVEHLEDPRAFMAQVWKWLKPGGHLVVEIPNSEATCQHPHSQFHIGHLYHFNLTALKRMQEVCGFKITGEYTSPDGGNIMAIGQKLATPDAVTPKMPENYQRVSGILSRHTGLTHLLTLHPYFRPIRKLFVRWDEKRAVRNVKSGKEVLDTLSSRL